MKYKLEVEGITQETHDAIFAMLKELEDRLTEDLVACAKFRNYRREEGLQKAAEKMRQWHLADETVGRYGKYKACEVEDEEE